MMFFVNVYDIDEKARINKKIFVISLVNFPGKIILPEQEFIQGQRIGEMTIQDCRISALVDLARLQKNFETIRTGHNGLKIMTVVKADAYGLGVHPVAETLKHAGTDGFCVATCAEGLELLEYGRPVQILGAVMPEELEEAVRHQFILGITDLETAEKYSAEAVRQNKTIQCHFKLDTGMGRLGILYHEAPEIIREAVRLPNLDCCGIYSHFPQTGTDFAEEQIRRFRGVLAQTEQLGIRFRTIHMANSDAVSGCPEVLLPPFNEARPGLALYRDVLSLTARIAAVRMMPAGHSIGYDRTCVLEKETRVGTITAGYADGLPLALSGRGSVLVNGVRCPILGRVSMDYTTIDLTACPDAKPGDTVTLLSKDLPLSEWAELKGTHVYDIQCAISKRVPRIYLR